MKNRRRVPLWLVIIPDILAVGLLVGGWFLARIVSDALHREEPIVVAEHRAAPIPTPKVFVTPVEEEAASPEEERA